MKMSFFNVVKKTQKKVSNKPKISLRDFRIEVKKEADRRVPDSESWFDLWHRHVDLDGDGNLSRLHRQVQLWALFRMMRKFEHLTQYDRYRYQIFACVYEKDSGGDAVYIHTQNPNKTPFPCELKVDVWLQKCPFWLSRHISLARYDIGESNDGDEKYYFIQRKTHLPKLN